ncbi:MAG: 5-formyltetrahydrofolate cyclo-ligase [Arsenophonus sp. ET-KM2-MAG3]
MKTIIEIQQQEIRKEMRLKRKQLSQTKQIIAANQILFTILEHQRIYVANNIAIFFSFDGEINTQLLIEYLWKKNKKIYLPVLNTLNHHHLLFLRYCSSTQLIKNTFNINEPTINPINIIPMKQLDILFVPLVAFDKQGKRLGMGGGFYDRLLANWQKKHFYPIGLAHDCQLVDDIQVTPWDISLPEIITPSKRWCW